jgi:hypothetical protein
MQALLSFVDVCIRDQAGCRLVLNHRTQPRSHRSARKLVGIAAFSLKPGNTEEPDLAASPQLQ